MASSPTYRQPTLKEAVRFMLISRTREYRRDCLKYWAGRFGNDFAAAVESEVRKKWNKHKRLHVARKKEADAPIYSFNDESFTAPEVQPL